MTDKKITSEQLRRQWQKAARAWIEGTAAGRNFYREGLLDQWMLRAVGDVAGKKIIDLGCGEGRFCRMLAERGANVIGIDICRPLIEYASRHGAGDETYIVGDMEDLGDFDGNSFDMAVSYISLVDILDYAKAIAEAHRVLKAGGRFVVCNLQPMCTADNKWLRDENRKQIHFRLDNYFNEGPRGLRMFDVPMINMHRTLSAYINCFLDTGFVLEGIREPKPSPEQVKRWPHVADNLRVPYFIIYLLRKP